MKKLPFDIAIARYADFAFFSQPARRPNPEVNYLDRHERLYKTLIYAILYCEKLKLTANLGNKTNSLKKHLS